MVGELIVSGAIVLVIALCLSNLYLAPGAGIDYDPMGPFAWPTMLGVLTILLLVIHILSLLRKRNEPGALTLTKWSLKEVVTSKLFLGALCLFVYISLLEYIGFLIATPLFILSYPTLLGQQSWRVKMAAMVLATLALYFLFSAVLQVPLPRGYGIFRGISMSLKF